MEKVVQIQRVKGAMQRAEESFGPPISALQQNTRGEGAGGTSAPPCCTSREDTC